MSNYENDIFKLVDDFNQNNISKFNRIKSIIKHISFLRLKSIMLKNNYILNKSNDIMHYNDYISNSIIDGYLRQTYIDNYDDNDDTLLRNISIFIRDDESIFKLLNSYSDTFLKTEELNGVNNSELIDGLEFEIYQSFIILNRCINNKEYLKSL